MATRDGRRGRRGPADESAYRNRRYRGSQYFTSRQQHQDLTVVVKRFPSAIEVDDADAPVFVLVHGLGVSSRYFQPLAAELAKTGRVFLVDLPGYGSAPNPRRDVTLDDHAAVLGAFIEQICRDWPMPGPPVIVGHSMGSNIVARLAAQFPDVVKKIVLMAPTMQPTRRSFWSAMGALLHDATRETPIVFGIAFTDYFLRCGLPYLLRQTPHLLGDRPEERMPQLDAEVIVVCGDRDTIVAQAWGKELATGLPNGRYVGVAGPHVIMHTQPARIAAVLVDFAAHGVADMPVIG